MDLVAALPAGSVGVGGVCSLDAAAPQPSLLS